LITLDYDQSIQEPLSKLGHASRDQEGHLKTVFVLLSRQVPYHDSTVDYEALLVQRNAPRWIRQLKKFGYLPQAA
jgi:hypothetical protein